MDVRTLGLGRPFAVELLDPHKTQATKKVDRVAEAD